ncbi:MAG: hypothetical protein V1809_06510 [Planctomycetota bacterium]
MEKLVITIRLGKHSTDGFCEVIRWLDDIGLSMKNPASALVTGFGPKGQFVTSMESVRDDAKNRKPGCVQLWFDNETDIFVSWNRQEVSIFLDGLEDHQKDSVLESLLKNFAVVKLVGSRLGWKMCFEYV